MKQTKRITALLLSVVMIFSFATAAFASDAADDTDIVLPSPVDNEIDIASFSKTVLDNPKIKSNNASKLVDAAFSFADADEKIPQLLKENVLTGQNVIDLICMIIDGISNSMSEDPTLAIAAGYIKYLFANDTLIRGLNRDTKFDGAAAKLKTASENGFTTIPDIKDSGITFTSEDFGFADGDAYGFIDAFVCSLSEIFIQLGIRNILGDFTDSVSNGVYKAGNYNYFIPLYELLGLEPISSVEFTSKVEQAQSAEGSADFNRLREAADLTFKPVADLLSALENNSSDTIIDVLPKLIYALDSGMVNELLHNLLDGKSLYGLVQFGSIIEDVDISTGLIWDYIDKSFVTGTEEEPAGFDFDKDGEKETVLPITKEQFDAVVSDLMYAFDACIKDSISATQKNRLALETDVELVCSIICDAVLEFVESEDGGAFTKKALNSADNTLVSSVGNIFVSLLQTESGRFILRFVQDPLVIIVWIVSKI